MKLKCANCGETPDHWQYVDQVDKQPLKGGRGEACAVIKCKVDTAEMATNFREVFTVLCLVDSTFTIKNLLRNYALASQFHSYSPCLNACLI